MPYENKENKMKQPHDDWAKYYDFVYEQTYGYLYNKFTEETINVIKEILPNKGTIIDFGAGTGRISFPLLEQGYSIIGVEKSNGMVQEFKRKANRYNFDVNIHNCSISEYQNGKADLAIALFTVLSYSISEEELSKNIKNICKHINSNGYFFFDIPDLILFNQNIDIHSSNLNRVVEITSTNEKDVYTYKENCSGIFNGEEFSYRDELKIRYWELKTIDKLLSENGCSNTLKNFSQFAFTGLTHQLYKKQ